MSRLNDTVLWEREVLEMTTGGNSQMILRSGETRRTRRGLKHLLGVAFMTSTLACSIPLTALAETPAEAADSILKNMSDYLATVQNLTLDFSADVEAISHAGQSHLSGAKIQFSSAGHLMLSRPDKIRVRRTGGIADVEFISDGKTLTIYGKRANAYAQADAAPTIDELIDDVRAFTGAALPGGDLLFSDVYERLSGNIEQAAYIGIENIDGTECHHLLFRTPDVDWQIWVEAGDKPIPRKYVVTSKWITGAPQYQLRISGWNDSPSLAADTYTFNPPEGAKAVDIKQLEGIGDLPASVAIGGQ